MLRWNQRCWRKACICRGLHSTEQNHGVKERKWLMAGLVQLQALQWPRPREAAGRVGDARDGGQTAVWGVQGRRGDVVPDMMLYAANDKGDDLTLTLVSAVHSSSSRQGQCWACVRERPQALVPTRAWERRGKASQPPARRVNMNRCRFRRMRSCSVSPRAGVASFDTAF